MSIPPFGGDVGVKNWSPKYRFLVPETRYFWQKCVFSGAKKWYFGCPKLKTETTFSGQLPLKMVE